MSPERHGIELGLNNKTAALWIKPSSSLPSMFYAVLINTLTVICIKMADSCSKPASICPVHRGVAGHADAPGSTPGCVNGIKSSHEMRSKSSRAWRKASAFGIWGKNQASIEYTWVLQLKNYNQTISQSFWQSYLLLYRSDCTGKYLLLWAFKLFFKNVRSMPRHFSLDYKQLGKGFFFRYIYFILYFWFFFYLCLRSKCSQSSSLQCDALVSVKILAVSSMEKLLSYNFRNIDWMR